MNIRLLTGLVVAASFFLTACDKAPESTDPAAPAEEKTALQSAVDAAKVAGDKAVEAVKEQSQVFSEKAGEMTEAAMAKGKELTAAAMERSKEMIAKSKEEIAEGKVDLAAATLVQLQKIKPSLPESLQDEITSLEEMLAKSAPEEAPAVAEATEMAEGMSTEAEAKMEAPKE